MDSAKGSLLTLIAEGVRYGTNGSHQTPPRETQSDRGEGDGQNSGNARRAILRELANGGHGGRGGGRGGDRARKHGRALRFPCRDRSPI